MAYVFLSGICGFSNGDVLAKVIGRDVTALEIPAGVTVIGEHALHGAKKLVQITFPKGLEEIGECAFSDCSACLSYDFSACLQVPRLDDADAFTGIHADAVIMVPTALYQEWVAAKNWALYADHIVAVDEAPDEPIEYSEGLSYFFKDTNSYLIMGYGDWDGEDLIIPPTYDDGTNGEHPVDELGFSIFGDNTKIKSATFPETITYIGSSIFENCTNLTHLYIPYITDIASCCIWGLTRLEYVKFKDIEYICGANFAGGNQSTVYDFTECAIIPTLESFGAGSEFGDNPIIKVPANLLDEWKDETNWALYADYIVAG